MGAILAKFRSEKTTYQLLERLEENIKSIEEFSISTQERQKRFVGNFLIISIGLYVIAFAVFYFLFFPPTWLQRIAYTTPLLIFPIVILLLKRLFAWYYQRKLNKNNVKLNGLRAEKKKIIEKVMDKETYKVAIDILNRFGDANTSTGARGAGHNHGGNAYRAPHQCAPRHNHHQPQSNHQRMPNHPPPPPTHIPLPTASATPYRSLAAPTNNTPVATRSAVAQPRQLLTAGAPQQNTPAKPSPFMQHQYARTPQQQQQQQYNSPYNAMRGGPLTASPTPYRQHRDQQLQQQQYSHTPFPIINHNAKGYMEKLVDFLVGDGINSRFAMICKDCLQHNGMATLEQYEYSAFRCAFCKALNPARKLRPAGPQIPGAAPNEATANKDGATVATVPPQSHRSGSVVSAKESLSQSDTSSGTDSDGGGTVDVGSSVSATSKKSADTTTVDSDSEKPVGEKKND